MLLQVDRWRMGGKRSRSDFDILPRHLAELLVDFRPLPLRLALAKTQQGSASTPHAPDAAALKRPSAAAASTAGKGGGAAAARLQEVVFGWPGRIFHHWYPVGTLALVIKTLDAGILVRGKGTVQEDVVSLRYTLSFVRPVGPFGALLSATPDLPAAEYQANLSPSPLPPPSLNPLLSKTMSRRSSQVRTHLAFFCFR